MLKSAIDRMEMASLKKGSTNAARAKVQRELLMSEDEKWGHILPSDGTPGELILDGKALISRTRTVH